MSSCASTLKSVIEHQHEPERQITPAVRPRASADIGGGGPVKKLCRCSSPIEQNFHRVLIVVSSALLLLFCLFANPAHEQTQEFLFFSRV